MAISDVATQSQLYIYTSVFLVYAVINVRISTGHPVQRFIYTSVSLVYTVMDGQIRNDYI